MSEEKTANKQHHEAVDVFTHAKTGFPGAWTDEEIQALLDLWEDVLSRPRSRRYSVSKRVYKRLSNKEGFKDVNREDIVRQMSTLRTEYSTYLGLQIIGIETVKPDYVGQLERIFSKTQKPFRQDGRRQRRNTEPTKQSEVSDDSDRSRSHSVNYEEKESKIETISTKADDALSSRRGRFPRMNVQRLIRTMVNQHNTMMELFTKIFTSLEESNSKTAALLEDLVLFQKVKRSRIEEQLKLST